jgi:tRNA A37 threonylcarbamoyladenosine dehydratase
MLKFWVIDTKAKIAPQSTYEQDGSEWYYGRSIAPETSEDKAVDLLKATLKKKHVEVETIISVVDYSSRVWDTEDDELYETVESYEKSKLNNEVITGVFASSMYLEGD